MARAVLFFLALHTPNSDAGRKSTPREAKYANYMAVGYNAFEFFLEFGQVASDPPEPHVHTRIVTAPAIAKGFCRSLTQSLAQYETTYGPAGEQPLEEGEDVEGTQS